MKLRFGPGAHSLTASFAGTKSYVKSSSGAQNLTVTATFATSTSLSASGTGPYTLTATVTGAGLPAPTGSVTFTDQTNKVALGSAALGAATTAQTFQAQTPYGTGGGPESAATGDFNADGIPDVAVANFNDNTVSVLLGRGDGTFQPQMAYGTGAGPTSVATGDFNGDGMPDLAVANWYDNTVSVLLGKGDGTFQSQTTYGTGLYPSSVAVGDFNGDGIPDLAVNNRYDNTVSVLLGNGDGTFGAQTTYATGFSPSSMAVGDFNGDGMPDLAVSNLYGNTVSVLLGNGDGTFGAQTTYGTGLQPTSVAVGDFNGDGFPDLAVTNNVDSTVSVLLNKGDGTFQAQTAYGTGGGPYWVTVGDFNGDGIPDLAVANYFDNTVSVLLNSVTQTATAALSNTQVVGTGTHALQAGYPGNNFYASGIGTVGVQAAPLATTLTLAAPSTATTSDTVQLVASLSPYAFSSLTSNGETLTFKDGTTILGTAALNNGTAALSVRFSSAGSHVLQATYAGDTNFAAASSNPATVTVSQAATFTITPTPGTETIKHGTLGGFILALKSVNGFTGDVKLSCSGGPTGSRCIDLPMTVHLNGTAYAVSGIFFPQNTVPGNYTVTFTGVSGALTNTATAKFTVE